MARPELHTWAKVCDVVADVLSMVKDIETNGDTATWAESGDPRVIAARAIVRARAQA